MASYTESLVTFLRALRGEGLSIGVSEVRDALTVMETLGFDDRDTLQIGLRSLLAKNLEQQQAFSAQFDRHFVSLAEARRREIEAWNLEQLKGCLYPDVRGGQGQDPPVYRHLLREYQADARPLPQLYPPHDRAAAFDGGRGLGGPKCR